MAIYSGGGLSPNIKYPLGAVKHHRKRAPAYSHGFKKGWYFMGTGIWRFDLENKTLYIPIALGVGKVFRIQGKLMHAFIKPQWVVDSDDKDKNGNYTVPSWSGSAICRR